MRAAHSKPLSHRKNNLIPSLLLSTASVTHIRLVVQHLPLSDLELISNAFSTLQHLDVADSGFRLAFTFEEVQGTRRLIRTYPEFTPTYVDTFFAPLARLPALHTFIFLYNFAKREETFTVSDLSHSLSWRDTATPELQFLQLHHMTLTKGADGAWTQGEAECWVERDDIADFATSM